MTAEQAEKIVEIDKVIYNKDDDFEIF